MMWQGERSIVSRIWKIFVFALNGNLADISMPSLCSVKILFRILNRNEYRCSNLRIDDGKYKYSRPTVNKCDYLKKDEDSDDEEKAHRKENERCITDFGVNQLTAIFMVR